MVRLKGMNAAVKATQGKVFVLHYQNCCVMLTWN